jgi:hypothetical protein
MTRAALLVLFIAATVGCGCQAAAPPRDQSVATTEPSDPPAAPAPASNPVLDVLLLPVGFVVAPVLGGLMLLDLLTGRHIFPRC